MARLWLRRDFRYAFRTLVRNPGFAVAPLRAGV